MRTRVADLLGVAIPIIQAPMGYIARSQLAAAVSEAGGLGIVETSSGRLDEVREEIARMKDLTDKPWGVNIAQLLVSDDDDIVDFVVAQGVRFVTTSAGDPARLVPRLKDAGLTVFHVVPSLRGALKAVAAGVDGLVVEGVEGGGFKNPDGASTMVLVPLIASEVEVPVVAAGGIVDGRSMAAALALGAEGAQMGTAMLASAESPVHDNWKAAILAAAETDTLIVNRHGRPAVRVLRTERTAAAAREERAPLPPLDNLFRLYFGGDMEAAFAFSGQVAGRVREVRTVREILEETWFGCLDRLVELGRRVELSGP
jgi:enoyl-[acyl-carrier protein] reductase II